jgi:putative transposase
MLLVVQPLSRPSSVEPAGRSTAGDILSRHGMVPIRRQRRRIGHPGKPTSQILAPNDVWSADFKGQFRTGMAGTAIPSRWPMGSAAISWAARH